MTVPFIVQKKDNSGRKEMGESDFKVLFHEVSVERRKRKRERKEREGKKRYCSITVGERRAVMHFVWTSGELTGIKRSARDYGL